MRLRNHCGFIGNLTRDPEGRTVPTKKGDVAVVKFGLAINGFRKEDPATFLDFEAWEGLAEFVANTLQKGDKVAVASEARVDKYEKDGQTVYRTVFRVGDLEALKVKKWAGPYPDGGESPAGAPAGAAAEAPAASKAGKAARPARKSTAVHPGDGDGDADVSF